MIFPGLQTLKWERLDAVLNAGPNALYLFCGDQYVRYDWWKGKIADHPAGYPQKIRDRWDGVTFDRIDAAIYFGTGKAYLFRGDRYISYDIDTFRADPGYPEFLPGNYVEDWKIFD